MDAARLEPAPHLRNKNLIEGAGASILEQRNGRGTAEDIIVNNTMYLYPIDKKMKRYCNGQHVCINDTYISTVFKRSRFRFTRAPARHLRAISARCAARE